MPNDDNKWGRTDGYEKNTGLLVTTLLKRKYLLNIVYVPKYKQ